MEEGQHFMFKKNINAKTLREARDVFNAIYEIKERLRQANIPVEEEETEKNKGNAHYGRYL